MKTLKKILCIILIITCIVNTSLVKASSLSSNNVEKMTKYSECTMDVVYVDGIELEINFDAESGDIIVSGETQSSFGELVLEPDGEAEIFIDNDNLEDEEYDVEIKSLTKSNFDVDIYDDNMLVTSYDSYGEVVEDAYEGQAAVSWGVVAVTGAILLTALVASGYIIYKSNVMYIMASVFYDTICAAKESIRKKVKKNYYPAYIDMDTNVTYINSHAISLTTAASLIASDQNVYSFTSAKAKKVINTAGYVPYSAMGTIGEYHVISGKTVYLHWHKGKTNSKGVLKKKGKAHSLYGCGLVCR